MPEQRIISRVQDGKGNIIEEIWGEISDEELYQEQLAQEFNDIHEKAILALNNWDSLTDDQLKLIVKNLLKYVLWEKGWLKIGILQ